MTASPPRPKDWNKTIDDLMQELKTGRRKHIGQPELDWAREYTRSLIPDGFRYPQKGDVYESLMDQSVRYMTHWYEPYTGGGASTIQAGERVWVHEPIHEKPISVYATPIAYHELEQRMVPTNDRSEPTYNGFSLSIDTMILLEKYRLVETNAPRPGSQEDGQPQ